MSLVRLGIEDPVYHAAIGPSTFGADNWGKINHFDQVLDGEPIGRGVAFEKGEIYRSFKMVFNKGRSWTDTPFFKGAARRIARGERLWNCTTPEELRERLERDIGALHRSMRTHGFLSQAQIARRAADDPAQDADIAAFARPDYPSRIRDNHEIKLGVNEAGDLLFLDGRHRFAVARLLRLSGIPCRIVFRHRDWVDQRRILAEAATASAGDATPLYAPEHPDLTGLRLSAPALLQAARQLNAEGWSAPPVRMLRTAA